MNNNKFKQIATLMLGGTLMLGSVSCTESFEDFNTNPKAPTPEQMEGDFASTATLISTMIPVMVQGQENNYQMIDQMIGCEYGRMTCARNHWGSDAYFATYNPSQGWAGTPFNTCMPQIYTPFFQIRDISGGEGLTYHWANLIRIFGTLRVSDCYGPIPFSKIGTGSDYQVAYDDMPDLFNAMLEQEQENADIAMLAAQYYLTKRMDEPAKKVLRQVVDIDPGNKPARLQLLSFAISRNDLDEVIRTCIPAVEYMPEALEFHYYLGIAYYQKGNCRTGRIEDVIILTAENMLDAHRQKSAEGYYPVIYRGRHHKTDTKTCRKGGKVLGVIGLARHTAEYHIRKDTGNHRQKADNERSCAALPPADAHKGKKTDKLVCIYGFQLSLLFFGGGDIAFHIAVEFIK